MLAERDLTVDSLRKWANLRNALFCGIFVAVTWTLSDAALSRGTTYSAILVVGLVVTGLTAVIFWRPVIGLYASVLLNLIMDPTVQHDPISAFTGYFHEDLNTFAHAGIAFNPLELLLIITTLAYILRAIVKGTRLQGGTLSPQVLIFGLFLLFGYGWGVFTQGDPKIGLFEVRAPFTMVMLYFLVTNLAAERAQLEQLLRTMIFGIGLLGVWGIIRFIVMFHGKSGGPDGAFGKIHEDAIFLAFFAVVALCRLLFGGVPRRRILLLLIVFFPALIVMFEMQRRAAFVSIFAAFVLMAVVLFYKRRRLFFLVVPIASLLVLVYSAAFWNSSSVLAGPIRAWRSQSTTSSLDTRDQASNQYRINEKADVRATIQSAPLTGIGFGHPFFDIHPLPILAWWPFQFYTPHAEILWIWLKVGAGGFIAFWVLICTALMQAGHVVRWAGATPLGAACLIAAIYIVMLLIFAYVDVGLANERCEVLLGTMLGIVGAAPRLLNLNPDAPVVKTLAAPELAAAGHAR